MTENERKAIDTLQDMITEGQSNGDVIVARDDEEELKTAIQALEEIQQCRAIGTIKEFKALKNAAKKAEWIFDDFTAMFGNPYCCSNCDEEFGDTYNYCPNCGAKMY